MTIFESFLNFFITSAVAAPVAGIAPQGTNFSLPIIMLVFLVFIYFTVWRPQSKRAKEQRDLLLSLAKDDEVVTIGGILGKISKLGDTYIVIQVADNVEITIQKSSVANVLPKGSLKSL